MPTPNNRQQNYQGDPGGFPAMRPHDQHHLIREQYAARLSLITPAESWASSTRGRHPRREWLIVRLGLPCMPTLPAIALCTAHVCGSSANTPLGENLCLRSPAGDYRVSITRKAK